MQNYIVTYTLPESIAWLFFTCQAYDGEHAEEQCRNAEPRCTVVWVSEGYTIDQAFAHMFQGAPT